MKMNDTTPAAPAAFDPITPDLLAAATRADQCLELAARANAAGDTALQNACLERAIALDRNSQAALLNLAALSLDQGDHLSTYSFLEEAARLAPLAAAVEPLHANLLEAARNVPELETYLSLIGRTPSAPAQTRRSVLVISSTFAPSDAAAARDLPELVHGLLARGHEVRVLTATTAPAADAALEPRILRSLVPGSRDNAARLRTALTKSRADLVLVADFDGLDLALLRPALERNVPVLHWHAGARPPFAVDELPTEAHYAIAPVSVWAGTALRNLGCETTRMEPLLPGVDFARWFRLHLPDNQRLRLCSAGPLFPGDGRDTFLRALGRLHEAGIDFTAEIAGEAADATYLGNLQSAAQAKGLAERVTFTTGSLDQAGLFALLARSNVLVAPAETSQAFSLLPLRALASGLAVVTSGLGGTREVVRDGIDGLVFTAGNDAALADGLSRLANEPELLTGLQRAGQGRALAFSVGSTVTRIEMLATEMHAAIAAAATELPELSAEARVA